VSQVPGLISHDVILIMDHEHNRQTDREDYYGTIVRHMVKMISEVQYKIRSQQISVFRRKTSNKQKLK